MYEILAPAGNEKSAQAAINSGANAIYLGFSSFSARANADNFDLECLKKIIDKAHFFGVKVYVTMNTIVKQTEVEEFIKTLLLIHNIGADAFLLQDIFLGKKIHELYPTIVLHLSTQAGVNNIEGAIVAKEYGFSRVVLARETALEEIKEIASFIETEVFIQGALCTCFSGQCYLSGFAGGNSGNRGRCKQPCRKKYSYNRDGYNEMRYALSLADLSVGDKIKQLQEVGVISFKIEGRMRREEYVAAAVEYYRSILEDKDKNEIEQRLSDLKRTFNRNNYTQGLAFGQDKRFISHDVQGHIGEKVGVVRMVNKRIYCESRYPLQKGDAFKILRKGIEVGGGVFDGKDKRGFFIQSNARLSNGDGVFITTDIEVNQRVLNCNRKNCITISLDFSIGKNPKVECKELSMEGDFVLQEAKNSAITSQEIKDCFIKTGEYPFTINFDLVKVDSNCFIVKSQLNAFRRAFYEKLFALKTKNKNIQYEYIPINFSYFQEKFPLKTAVIMDNFKGIEADIKILKPNDYSNIIENKEFFKEIGEKYLYLPSFINRQDKEIIEKSIDLFDGVYIENLSGIEFSKQWKKKLILGTGMNITNIFGTQAFEQYVVSKELDFKEQQVLINKGAFILSGGDIKVMDLLYCPFEKTCNICDKKSRYELTDENGRVFPIKRYVLSSCRFEVYNCASLVASQNFANRLIDLSSSNKKECVKYIDNEQKLKQIFPSCTSGHSRKSVL